MSVLLLGHLQGSIYNIVWGAINPPLLLFMPTHPPLVFNPLLVQGLVGILTLGLLLTVLGVPVLMAILFVMAELEARWLERRISYLRKDDEDE